MTDIKRGWAVNARRITIARTHEACPFCLQPLDVDRFRFTYQNRELVAHMHCAADAAWNEGAA